MPTKAGHFIDVILEAPTRAALASWFNDPLRELHRIWVKPGTPDMDAFWNNWNPTYVASATEYTVGPPTRSLFYLRMLQTDYDDIIAAAPPSSAVNIVESADWFGPRTYADPEAPTEAELYGTTDVFYKASLDDAKRDKIREYFPYDTGQDDGAGGTIKRGLRLGAFDEGRKDWKGSGEL